MEEKSEMEKWAKDRNKDERLKVWVFIVGGILILAFVIYFMATF